MAAAGGLWDAAPVPRNYFDERIARSYQAKWPELFEPGVVDPAVRFLAGPVGTGAALELGVPGLQRLPAGETLRAFAVTPEHLGFEEYAAATQIAFSHTTGWSTASWRPSRLRSAWCGRRSWT
jgi:hypothetical protein